MERKLGLGGTKICYDALTVGDVDVYVEYTGTIAEAIKSLDGEPTLKRLGEALAPDGVEMLPPLGFKQYLCARARAGQWLRRADYEPYRIWCRTPIYAWPCRTNSSSVRDGWPGLTQAYGFAWTPAGIEHALASPGDCGRCH